MRIAGIFIALLLFSSVHAEFLASYDSASGKIWVLCENQSSVFVSGQDGLSREIALDANSQADFTPAHGGKYAVQCGKAALAVTVPSEPPAMQLAKGREDIGWIAIAALAVLFSFLVALVALRVLLSQSWFCKSVEGNRARITLRAGSAMKNVLITDPVAIGHSGGQMEFSIRHLDAGREWQAEYEVETPENILPASLQAECKGGRVSMLSQLIADFPAGKPEKPQGAQQQPHVKKKVPKNGG
ncbi:MAG: hypothetical protein WCT52_05025 [Candidatus Micrarchaeia archaeon]